MVLSCFLYTDNVRSHANSGHIIHDAVCCTTNEKESANGDIEHS